MKFLLISLALIGLAAAAQLPDSATQGPNPQDIATPEPEYIDIDLPEPPRPAAPVAMASLSRSSFSTVPRPIQRPVAVARSPTQNYLPPIPGHTYNQRSGYQYRRPVRRVYYRRRY